MHPLLQQLRRDNVLSQFIVAECRENDICVNFDLQIDSGNYLIIKVDDYYNSLNLGETPPSIDCLIIHVCEADESLRLYLIELKNVNHPQKIDRQNLEQKFETTLFDFLGGRFNQYFDNYDFKVKLMLCAGNVIDGALKGRFNLDFLLGLRIFKFRNKLTAINGYPPNPSIRFC